MRLPFGWKISRETKQGEGETIAQEPETMAAATRPEAPKDETPKPAGTSQAGFAVGTTLFQLGDFPRYNPDDLLIKKGRDVYDKMMRDDQVKACVQFKRDAVTSRKYDFDKKPAESGDGFDPEHERIEKFFKHVIAEMDMPFKDGLDAILTGMKNGFSITEKVYKEIDWDGSPYWGIKKLVLLPFWSFDGGIVAKQGTSDVTEFRQRVGGRAIATIPRDKVVYFVHQPDIDPLYGESDLKAAYRPWWSKDIAIKFQNVHLERHAGGFITANVKDAAVLTDPKLKADLKQTLQNVSALTAILAPVGVDIELVAPARTDAYDKAIQGYDKAIAKSVLVPNLLGLSEQGDTGSYSQSQTQLEVFYWVLDNIVIRLEDALNRQVFAPLALENFGTKDYPKFRFDPLTAAQKREIAKAWGELMSKAAVTHSEVDEQHTRKLLDYPALPDDMLGEIGNTPGTQPGGEAPDPEEGGGAPGTGKAAAPGSGAAGKRAGWADRGREVHEHSHYSAAEIEARPWLKRVDFKAIKASLDNSDKRLAGQMADILARAKKYILDQIAAISGEKSFGGITPEAVMDIGKMPRPLLSELRTAIRTNLQRVLDEQYETAKKELPARAKRFKDIRPGMDKLQAERFLSSRAMKIAGILDQDLLNDVQLVLENAIRYDKNLRDTIEALETSTDLVAMLPRVDAALHAVNIPARLENIARTNISDATNTARMALFGQPEFNRFIQAFEYSSILDDRTTETCEALNGDIRRDWGSYTPPNHYQCRSILVPVTDEDNWDGKQDKIPASIKPQKGFA